MEGSSGGLIRYTMPGFTCTDLQKTRKTASIASPLAETDMSKI
jgi:hypothetical protein